MSDNVAAGNFVRHLRAVTCMLGRPAVVVPAHPARSSDKGLLIPYGGGAIIDEVDGNLTLSRAIDVCKLHWQAKLLGPNFEPVLFRFRNYSCDEVRDAKGRRVIMPLLAPYVERPAEPLALPAPDRVQPRAHPEQRQLRGVAAPPRLPDRSRDRQGLARFDEATLDANLLRAIVANPSGTQKDWAAATGVAKSSVNSRLMRLRGKGPVQGAGRSWTVTQKGRARIEPTQRKKLPVRGSRRTRKQ